MRVLKYKTLLREEPEGGYTVFFPSLPGCITYGKDIKEALAMAKEAVEGHLMCLKEHGEEIPSDAGMLEYDTFIEDYA